MRTRLVATFAGVSLCGLALAADPANGLDQTVIVKQGMSDLTTFLKTNSQNILQILTIGLLFIAVIQILVGVGRMIANDKAREYAFAHMDEYEDEDDD